MQCMMDGGQEPGIMNFPSAEAEVMDTLSSESRVIVEPLISLAQGLKAVPLGVTLLFELFPP